MSRLAPVPAPAPERPLVNLLAAARTPMGETVRWQEGTQYESQSCGRVLNADVCAPSRTDLVRAGVGPDDPEGRLVQTVAVYAVADYECRYLPGTIGDFRDRALATLDAELPRAVEHELWTGGIARLSDLPNRYLTDPANLTDLTPGSGPVAPTAALGLLEDALGDVYSGPAIVHVNRRALYYLPQLTRNGKIIETRAGNRVVPGVGYPGTGPALDPVANLTATPAAAGTLADDTYEYAVSATSATGETLAAEASATVAGAAGAGSVDLAWDAVPDATGYRIYGRQAGALVLLGTNAAGDETFTDTGAAAAGADTPPTTDTSGAPGLNDAWLYITPMVTVRLGTPEAPDEPSVDRDTNRAHITARVPYEVSWDGCVGAFGVQMVQQVEGGVTP